MMVENECNNEVKPFLFCFGPLSLMTKSNNTILVHSNLNGVSHLPSLVLCPGCHVIIEKLLIFANGSTINS